MAEKKSGCGGLDGVTIAVIVVVIGLAIFGNALKEKVVEWLGSSVGERVVAAFPWVVGGLGGVAVVGVARIIVGAMRKKRRKVIEGATADVLPKSWDGSKGLRIGWFLWRAKPRKVTVVYPPESPDRDVKWRMEVESVVGFRCRWEEWKAQWKAESLTLAMRWVKPVPVVVTTEARNREQMEKRVETIVAPLIGTKVGVSVGSWTANPVDPPGGYPLVIDVVYEPTTRDISENWRRRLETVVSLKVPPGDARWSADYFPAEDRLVLRHRPELPSKLMHTGPQLWQGYRGVVLPYAVDATGEVAVWAVSGADAKRRPTVHTLIIGATGTGKTSVMRGLLTAATGQGMFVLGADPKRIELTPFRGWPGVLAVASSEEDLGLIIKAANDLMQARYLLIEDHNSGDCSCGSGALCPGAEPDTTMPTVFFFLDELLILKSRLNRWWNLHKGDEGIMQVWGTKTGTEHPALGMVADLLALARSANIRLVEGVQRPDASLFQEGSRDNLRHRIGMGPLSQQGSEMLWGNPYTGTDIPLVAGRAMASPDGTTPIEVQTFWVPDPRSSRPDDQALMAKLYAAAEQCCGSVGMPAGLDLSALSDRARHMPEGPVVDDMTVMGQVADHGEDMVTQTVFVDQLAGPTDPEVAARLGMTSPAGDRVVVDGHIWAVRSVEELDNDYVAVTLDGPDGVRTEEVPSDATFDRVVEAAAQTANV